MVARSRLLLVATLAAASISTVVAARTSAAATLLPAAAAQQHGWAATRVNAVDAWPAESATTITIAVVDTGVDPSQPDLAGKLVTGYDATTGGASTSDAAWHGTAVASIAAGAAESTLGVVSYCGQCSVMPIRALDASGHGSDPTIARGLRWAVDHGARVVNLSLDGPSDDPALPAAIRYASRKGVVVVAAAGNEGSSAPAYPAAEPLAIGVAATDQNDRLYPWSNRGRWVTIAAPGINLSAVPGGGVFPFMGTSSAAALISGVAGLCLSASPSLTPALVRRALVGGASPVAGATFGRVDAARTLALCRSYADPTTRR